MKWYSEMVMWQSFILLTQRTGFHLLRESAQILKPRNLTLLRLAHRPFLGLAKHRTEGRCCKQHRHHLFLEDSELLCLRSES